MRARARRDSGARSHAASLVLEHVELVADVAIEGAVRVRIYPSSHAMREEAECALVCPAGSFYVATRILHGGTTKQTACRPARVPIRALHGTARCGEERGDLGGRLDPRRILDAARGIDRPRPHAGD